MPVFVDAIYVKDSEGNLHLLSGTGGVVGTAAMLEAGTDETPRLFSAKDINAEIARQIAAIV